MIDESEISRAVLEERLQGGQASITCSVLHVAEPVVLSVAYPAAFEPDACVPKNIATVTREPRQPQVVPPQRAVLMKREGVNRGLACTTCGGKTDCRHAKLFHEWLEARVHSEAELPDYFEDLLPSTVTGIGMNQHGDGMSNDSPLLPISKAPISTEEKNERLLARARGERWCNDGWLEIGRLAGCAIGCRCGVT